MNYRILSSFEPTELQKEMLIDFCNSVIDSDYFVSVRAVFSEDLAFSLSMFSGRPEICFGIYSSIDKEIVAEPIISDIIFAELLNVLAEKYAHATTRKPPVVNKELAFAWIDFFNKCKSGLITPHIIQ